MKNTPRLQQIGLDRIIRLNWLKATADIGINYKDDQMRKAALEDYLKNQIDADPKSKRGTFSKTLTVLMKIWFRVPNDLVLMRERGLIYIRNNPGRSHLAIHWGMISSVYPFWSAVASHVGRLIRLQGDVSAIQIQRRLREKYGERETVSRRVRYVLRSFVDWEVLKESSKKGIYNKGQVENITTPEFASWLIESEMRAKGQNKASLKSITDSTSSFPFIICCSTLTQLTTVSNQLEILRQNIDDDLIVLKR